MPVEIGPCAVYPVVAQDVGASVQLCALARPDPHQGEVRSAAANVGDKHQLFAVHRGLVVHCRGYRLVLETDVGEPH